MKRIFTTSFIFALLVGVAIAQTTQQPSRQQEAGQEEVIRISTALVQTDVVVTDKNDRILPDLKLSDFEVYENGRKQDLKFMEFVGVDSERRIEGDRPVGLPPGAEIPRDLSAKELKRVVAFVVDDLSIPFEDNSTVRELLLDFVNNQMREGDLVAIVRVIGGKPALQQFTSDRQLLRRAIATLNIQTHAYSAFNNPAPDRIASKPTLTGEGGEDTVSFEDQGAANMSDPNNEDQRLNRGYFTLSTANFVIDSLREIPGRKSLVLISGGIPIFEPSSTGTVFSNFSYLLNSLTDNAVRSGVVISTLDPRGLNASPGVASFDSTPMRSALGTAPDPNFGRGGSSAGREDIVSPAGLIAPAGDNPFGALLSGASEHLGLSTVAGATGGVSVVNTNNFKTGLDKILARSNGYYLLAYSPLEKFDNKFRKIEVKVKRDGVKIYTHRGYVARTESGNTAPRTKEEIIMAAVKSPLARRDVEVAANITVKPSAANNKTAVEIHMLIDANKLTFTQTPDGKYASSFDVVGFVYDQLGKLRGGFSETVTSNLSPETYKQALKTGLTYSRSTDLPPGYFQIRAAARDTATGNLGTITRFLEIPNLTNGHLAMSSVFLFAANPTDSKVTPTPLLALRQITRNQDLRYAAMIYNAKMANNRQQLRSRMMISQGSKILYQEPDQPIEDGTGSPVTKIGQLGLSKVPPGRYVLTLLVTDPLADKKMQTVARSIDFTVIP